MNHPRIFWVTGAGSGLGLALVEQLLGLGHRVATSGKDCQALDTLAAHHGSRLLRLPWQLHDEDQAASACLELCHAWGALDSLIINAGATDYLPDAVSATDVFETIVSSNQLAAEHCLGQAVPLLLKGEKPQVMAIFNRYSALQLYAPTRVTAGWNNTPQWFREARQSLKNQGIDLTVVAPHSLKTPVTSATAFPEDWTPQSAAQELLQRLPLREPELVLEVTNLSSLWPLSR
ncbi:short-chain dehydrogenase [Pseudomonas sp. SG-MS2]|uniref:SDR family NAD(P)-dependent oxidoreductase n=1 Tax=Pseudomonas putida TaxID=303 RepID=A0A7Y7Z6U1_PSEPU|nr:MULTISPECIES: SDR family NAD(P)-dependent oxidoreductase [Pseudomonas]KAF1310644.1 short-chain dehydrogenase [Pseudomonas sp. SG-MS2]NWC79381.1 SDR family NAD(P)-dependent oxidoreductase [Pseudomonas putida]